MLIHVNHKIQDFVLEHLEKEVKTSPDLKNRSQLIRDILSEYVNKADRGRAINFLNELKMFRQEFARIGSNLNQIAHSYNMSAQINRSDLENNHEELRQEFKKIFKELKILNGNF
ncbi:MAG: plasmid mobilization relaxosome protein MobC [Desulfobacteraceae bacterium]|nr:plasmid mobilization relaxosome protein MobC [Desulfobacteraceae bacterium]